MQISLGGQTHFITAERQQIFDLLISTYEEAIRMTETLRLQQSQIAHAYQSLQGLYKIAECLNPSITETDVAEMALERISDFPDVLGGCIRLLDSGGKFRDVVMRNFVPAEIAASCPECTCRKNFWPGTCASRR
ncbi:hypothetical protein [Noviherbaspirillum sp.]|uniref:hypothetical protein n=1 Tax=Noviherbaspirillum sp. TaxID=1926288 RepID=UPI002B461EA7|nr:hypothetical protein [Noviherbaspirillum sp.]HJV80007.1 hypothetical protein [Noviherbaspirillum sp.]